MPVKRNSTKRCTLRGKSISSSQEFYDQISQALGFPDYFGRNLDALWDVLTGDVEGPVKIVWKDAAASKAALGKDFEKIKTLLKEVAKEREDFEVVFD